MAAKRKPNNHHQPTNPIQPTSPPPNQPPNQPPNPASNPPSNHREKILRYLAILKIKVSAQQLDQFAQQFSQGAHSLWEIVERFLERPAIASQESAFQARIKRANFPTAATLESYDWTRNPQTIMPAYFRSEGFTRVGATWQGKTVLAAQQIEDVVAYLRTLR